MADPEHLLAQAEATGFDGWDFTTLGDRLTLDPPPWDFPDIVAGAAAGAETMLDMGTGGGEWLSSLQARAPRTVATESWPPNVGVAASRLHALGVPVVQTEGAPDNHRREPAGPGGRLPFCTDAFDLVSNRHESFRADEVARVLRRGGVFLTQQAQSGMTQFHELLGVAAPDHEEFELALAVAQLREAGLRIDEADVGVAPRSFLTSVPSPGTCGRCPGPFPTSQSRGTDRRSSGFTAVRFGFALNDSGCGPRRRVHGPGTRSSGQRPCPRRRTTWRGLRSTRDSLRRPATPVGSPTSSSSRWSTNGRILRVN
jgi:SAM-dependent methyltransferase